MKNYLVEDQKDVEDIRSQKREHERSAEELIGWEFGRGLKRESGNQRGVRG
jgi:hypothetical protein